MCRISCRRAILGMLPPTARFSCRTIFGMFPLTAHVGGARACTAASAGSHAGFSLVTNASPSTDLPTNQPHHTADCKLIPERITPEQRYNTPFLLSSPARAAHPAHSALTRSHVSTRPGPAAGRGADAQANAKPRLSAEISRLVCCGPPFSLLQLQVGRVDRDGAISHLVASIRVPILTRILSPVYFRFALC
jgi:hypothetical protein